MPWPFSEFVDMMMYKIKAWGRSSAFLIGFTLDRVKEERHYYINSVPSFNIHHRPYKTQLDIKVMYEISGTLLQYILCLFVVCVPWWLFMTELPWWLFMAHVLCWLQLSKKELKFAYLSKILICLTFALTFTNMGNLE